MKIIYKLMIAFLLLSVLLGFIGYVSFRNVSAVYGGYNAISQQTLPAISYMNTMRRSVLEIFAASSEITIYSADGQIDLPIYANEMGEMNDARETFNESLAAYGDLVEKYFPDEQETLDGISEKWAAFSRNVNNVLQFRGNASLRKPLFGAQMTLEGSKEDILHTLDTAIAFEQAELEGRQEAAKADVAGAFNKILVVIWLFAFLSAAGILVAYSISVSITKLRDGSQAVGKGNLYTRVDVDSKDELGELADSFNQMVIDLRKARIDIESRGSELNQKVNELTDTKKALLNMMEDAEEINAELVHAEERLKKNVRELQDADTKKNQFMSIAAHELKTPITSIHGFAQLLQNRDIAMDSAKREKYLEIIEHETKRLAKLITDILDLSRIDLKVMKLNFEDVDIAGVVEHVKTEMSVQIKANGLEAEYEVDKLPKIRTDRERLTQVLLNLLTNSVKYTPKGKISVRIFRDKSEIHFIVKDTGIGIPKEYHDKIFTRFYQVDSSYTRKAGGVGLGLSLCKELVTLLGGRIWFESAIDKGTAVHFTLPAE